MSTEPTRRPIAEPRVTVILPVFNEKEVLAVLADRVIRAVEGAGAIPVILFVDDGSTDGSGSMLDELAAREPRLRVLHLSRNFGHQSAIQAGLVHAEGDATILMDADLQDDPDAVSRFLEKWREGYDVVYAVRVNRKEGAVKRALFAAFYRILGRISDPPIPLDAGAFGLVDARVAREVAAMADRDRYYPGLRRWVGFRQAGIEIERGARYDDHPRVSFRGLWRLAKAAIFSFSSTPLHIFYSIAFLSMISFAFLACFTLYHRLFTGLAIPGWTSIVMTACFFGALNALGIAILGEYVLRIYDQVRARPLFVVARKVNFPAER